MVAKMNIIHAAGLVDGYSGIAHLAPAQVPAPGVWGCAHQRLVACKVVIIALMQNTQYDNWFPPILCLNELFLAIKANTLKVYPVSEEAPVKLQRQ